MNRQRLIPMTILLAMLVMPVKAFAEGDGSSAAAAAEVSQASKTADDAKKVEEADDDKCWGVNGTLGFDLGLGAFTKDKHARKIRSRMTFEVGGYYTIPVIDVDVHAETGFSLWLSEGGGSNGKHEFRWTDSNIGFSRNIWEYKNKRSEFSLSFDADLSFTLPTSKVSWTSNLYTTIMPTVSVGIKFAQLRAGYSITYGHNFNKYTSMTYDPSEVDVLSRSTGNEILSSHDIAEGGILNEIELTNKFYLGYQFIKELGLNVGLGFADVWTYKTKSNRYNDEFVSQYAKVGRGHSQISAGSIALTYTPIKYLSLTLGVMSTQPWKTADQKNYRFPWFDTVSPSKNYTKFLFQVSAQY